jgi:predicted RNase H-like HicB family nuclease
MCYYQPAPPTGMLPLPLGSEKAGEGWCSVSVAQTYRVELERLDHGYEARVPSIHGCLSVGLTEGETLQRLREAVGMHIGGGDQIAEGLIRLEIFRT